MKDWREKIRGATMTTDEFGGLVLDRENDVKRVGYRSANDQIMELTRAGMRLQASREEQYSKPSGLIPRQYGEIDKTVADEKIYATREAIKERIEAIRISIDGKQIEMRSFPFFALSLEHARQELIGMKKAGHEMPFNEIWQYSCLNQEEKKFPKMKLEASKINIETGKRS